MFRKMITKPLVSYIAASLLAPSLVISTADLAFSGLTGGVPSAMVSQGPCSYSLQLQKSVVDRKRYLVKLDAALGGQLAGNSAVEEMYSDIKPASYSADASDYDPWGIGTRSAEPGPVGLDSFSTECISCHDGASAVAIGANVRNDPFASGRHSKHSGTDHPVGMDYQSYVAASGRKYKPIFGLNSKMVLVDGKVGCLTCHDPLNPERKHLVMSDTKSALCLSCHDK